jgi:hypothetical protein
MEKGVALDNAGKQPGYYWLLGTLKFDRSASVTVWLHRQDKNEGTLAGQSRQLVK